VIRWVRFSAVGIAGTGVQLLALWLLLKLRMNYLAATALAVEAAVLHNYVWHSLWTWRGLTGSLWRFQLSNGLVLSAQPDPDAAVHGMAGNPRPPC